MLHFAYQCHFQANNFIRGRGMVTCYFQFVGEKCDIQNKCHSISSIKIHAVSCLALENYRKAVLNQKRNNNNLIFSLTLSDSVSVQLDRNNSFCLLYSSGKQTCICRVFFKRLYSVSLRSDPVFSQSFVTCFVQ